MDKSLLIKMNRIFSKSNPQNKSFENWLNKPNPQTKPFENINFQIQINHYLFWNAQTKSFRSKYS
jgi:hypothetical protein